MSFDRVRVAYRPALTVLVAHEHLAIIANLPRDTARFCCHAGFAVVRLLRPVLSHSDLRTSAEPGRMKWSSTFSSCAPFAEPLLDVSIESRGKVDSEDEAGARYRCF